MIIIPPPPYSPSTFETALSVSNELESKVPTLRTYVDKYRPSAILAAGNTIRLTVEAGLTGGGTITDTFISLAAVSGDAWDSASTPTRITWNDGQSSLTLVKGKTYVSDEISFLVDDAVAIMLSYNVAANTYVRYRGALGSAYVAYGKVSVSEAGSADRGSGYVVTGGYSHFLKLLEVAN